MRRISACSPNSAERLIRGARASPLTGCGLPRFAARGFTLLELLVVLALAAALVAVVAPAGGRALEAARVRAAERSLTAVLESLPLRARRTGAALQRDVPDLLPELQAWPVEWTLSLRAPLQYSADGVARGGELEIREGKRIVATIMVEPITGAPLPKVSR